MEIRIVKFFNKNFHFINPIAWILSYKMIMVVLLSLVAYLSLLFDAQNGLKIFSAFIMASLLHFSVSEGIMKHTFWRRTRPYLMHPEEIVPLGVKQRDSSFPSSHVAATSAVLTVYLYFYPQYWPLMLTFYLVLSISRMHSGMHYLSDVIAGTALGIIYGLAGIYALNYLPL